MKRPIGWLVVAGLIAVLVPRDAAAISPFKMFQKMLQFDGAGSGLDADKVQGQTPQDIITAASTAAGAGVGAAIGAFLNSAYTLTSTIVVSDGFCNCAQQACSDGNDFLLNCGGATTLTTGYLTTVREVPGQNRCEACGCGNGGSTGLAVTASCLVR
jgi:hypothetical protein